MRQVVGDGDDAPVMRDGEVAGVDPGPDFGHDLQAVQVILGDPAIAGGEIDEPSLGGEFWATMQGEAAFKPGDRFEPVAVQNGDMVIAAFDNDEQVQRIGGKDRRWGQRVGIDNNDVAGDDLRVSPDRRRGQWRKNQIRQRRDLVLAEYFAESGHLCRGAAQGDGSDCAFLTQPFETFRQQCGAGQPQSVDAVTGGAMFLIQPPGISCLRV